ncbi:MAG: hypothetical protein K9L17_04120 [Clostridiales bacterium]|nr:hypothetical protein [Clostridiales bacterium]
MSFRILNGKNNMHYFLKVPSYVYSNQLVPPTASSYSTMMRFFRPANSVLQHLHYANFTVVDEDRPVGRICAAVDDLNPRKNEGFWGCFECINDYKIAKSLFDAAADWLKKNNKTIMLGPATLNTNQEVGLLIKGFEHEMQNEIPYNPPYYQDLVENAEMEKVQDLECFKWQLPDSLPEKLVKARFPDNLVIRPINYKMLSKELKIINQVINKSMARIWGFIPMTQNDTREFLMAMAERVPRNLFKIIEVDGKPAGMLLSIPYVKPSHNRGGKLRLAVGGMVPDFQCRGIHWAVLNNFYNTCRKLGFTEGEASQVAESNDAVKRRIIKPLFGGEIIKNYRVYQWDIS